MSLFFVDSASELDDILTHKMGVERINIPFAINDERKEFEEEFDFKKFYSKCKKGVCLEKINLDSLDYEKIFEPCLEQGDDIAYVHASSEIMDMCDLQKARETLLEKYPDRKFELIDSKNISIGQGLVSYACAMLYRKGESIVEIQEHSLELAKQYAMFFVVDSTEALVNHNVVGVANITGTALNIKSIFAVDIDGKIKLFDKISGKKKAVSKLLEICRQMGANVADFPIGIAYSNDEAIATELEGKIYETFGNEINLIKTRITPSNAVFMGSGVLAISFHVHHKIH